MEHQKKIERRGGTRSLALLIKDKESQTFAEVLSEIRYRIKSEISGAEVSSIRKMKSGGIFDKLGL